MLPDTITTKCLTLRPHRLTDVDDVFAFAQDPKWARYLPVPHPYSYQDAEQFIAGQVLLDKKEHQAWAIEFDFAVVGGINIRLNFDHRLGEMGYSIAHTHWGKGFMTEAAQAMVNAAFLAYPDLNRIRAMAHSENIGSLRVMEKLGMQPEGTLRQNNTIRGELFDEVWCGILRGEWEAGGP